MIEHTLLCGEEVITLTIREFQLLELLMRNCGRVITREVILERIWGYEVDITSNTLDALVKLLRNCFAAVLKNPKDRRRTTPIKAVGCR